MQLYDLLVHLALLQGAGLEHALVLGDARLHVAELRGRLLDAFADVPDIPGQRLLQRNQPRLGVLHRLERLLPGVLGLGHLRDEDGNLRAQPLVGGVDCALVQLLRCRNGISILRRRAVLPLQLGLVLGLLALANLGHLARLGDGVPQLLLLGDLRLSSLMEGVDLPHDALGLLHLLGLRDLQHVLGLEEPVVLQLLVRVPGEARPQRRHDRLPVAVHGLGGHQQLGELAHVVAEMQDVLGGPGVPGLDEPLLVNQVASRLGIDDLAEQRLLRDRHVGLNAHELLGDIREGEVGLLQAGDGVTDQLPRLRNGDAPRCFRLEVRLSRAGRSGRLAVVAVMVVPVVPVVVMVVVVNPQVRTGRQQQQRRQK
mmetsp:Transcript_16378/g.49289  ORF Transcript_16378/g.49289 Transcript_16378/m.49289 type:complete len:369 (+) Transcript_16378:482-1588(+)